MRMGTPRVPVSQAEGDKWSRGDAPRRPTRTNRIMIRFSREEAWVSDLKLSPGKFSLSESAFWISFAYRLAASFYSRLTTSDPVQLQAVLRSWTMNLSLRVNYIES